MDNLYSRNSYALYPNLLPPPSQLHLHSNPPNTNNTLPPISAISVSDSDPSPASAYPLWSRTSSARDDHSTTHQQSLPVKKESSNTMKDGQSSEDPMPSTSDFVKKLYKMLEDPAFQPVVSWGPQGDCFVVKDMNEFTKSILPRMFKHSNFASFVRQLNKYDFHKVKNTDDNQFGEHSWTFRHPDFHADRRDSLENIKRKVPSQRKAPASVSNTTVVPIPQASSSVLPSSSLASTSFRSSSPTSYSQLLEHEVRRLQSESEDLRGRVRFLERGFQDVLQEMAGFKKGMAHQDALFQRLLEVVVGEGRVKPTVNPQNPQSTSSLSRLAQAQALHNQGYGSSQTQQPASLTQTQSQPLGRQVQHYQQADQQQTQLYDLQATGTDQNPFLPPQAAARFMDGDAGRATLLQMSDISRRAEINHGRHSDDNDLNISIRAAAEKDFNRRIEMITSGLRSGDPPDKSGGSLVAEDELLPSSDSASSRQWGGQNMSAQKLAKLEEMSNTVRWDSNRHRLPQQGESMQQKEGDTPTGTSSSGFMLPPTSQSSLGNMQAQSQSQGRASSSSWPPPVSTNIIHRPSGDEESPSVMAHEGLQVYTVGHLMPRSSNDNANGQWSLDPLIFDSNSHLAGSTAGGYDGDEERVQPSPSSPSSSTATSNSSNSALLLAQQKQKTLRVRRQTFVPGWAVPPRVLLVDDDAVNRRLSSKFLQVFGCTIDVAVDGVGAVNKMNLEKYDLVLMDIVMPKLDGVSATSLIRKFDHMTPIISMTANSKPNEIMTYYSSGMNDILPKPFTKKGLLDMLEKHLTHLKTIQQMSRGVPRSPGAPDGSYDQQNFPGSSSALVPMSSEASGSRSNLGFGFGPSGLGGVAGNAVGSAAGTSDDDGRINPLAGMGLTDEQYNIILQNIVNGENFMGVGTSSVGSETTGEKRLLDDVSDGREGKRSRFEVIE